MVDANGLDDLELGRHIVNRDLYDVYLDCTDLLRPKVL